MSTKDFVLALARGARGKDAANALILPQIFGGTGYVNAGTELTVTGTPPLTLPNSLGKPLKAWEVALSLYQDLHGYDNPWPAGGGKNLFNKATRHVAMYIKADGELAESANWCASDYIPILPETSYIYSGYSSSGSIAKFAFYDSNKVSLGTDKSITNTNSAFVTPANASYIRLSINSETADNAQFEQGSIATPYAPYSNICPILGTDKLNMFVEESYDQSATSKAVITLPQTVYNGTVGSEGGESRWGEVDLGDLTWTNVGSTTHRIWRANLQDAKTSTSSAGLRNAICSIYVLATNGSAMYNSSEDNCFLINSAYLGGIGFIYVRDSDYDNATGSDVKTALNGVQVVYELETPIPFTTDGHTIKLPKGTATTWATAEDGTVESMEVAYVSKK